MQIALSFEKKFIIIPLCFLWYFEVWLHDYRLLLYKINTLDAKQANVIDRDAISRNVKPI